MPRCESYYKLENRRCDRPGTRELRAADGEHYLVCDYHRRQNWTTLVAHWNGETDLRRSAPTGLRSLPQPKTFAWQ